LFLSGSSALGDSKTPGPVTPRHFRRLAIDAVASARLADRVAMLEETDRQVDNARARVTRHRLAPGAHTGFHRHEYDYVVVPITGGRMRIVEGGKESLADLSSGTAYFRGAGVEHDVFNGGDQEMIFVEVELIG
jgi:beta-alanine degradation protein BauB